jgi:MFS family permease
MGTQMQVVAINWHIYLLTRSPLALGLVGLVRVCPIIVFSLWGGIVADRHDRRRVMFAAQAGMALAAAALGLLTFFERETVSMIYLLTAVGAAASAFDNPARQALIPRLVPPEDLPGALSLNLTAFHAALIGGPAVAGLLIAGIGPGGPAASLPSGLHVRGLAIIYGLNALSFVGVLVTLWLMETSGRVAPGRGPAGSPLHDLREGLTFVWGTPIMVWTMTLDFFATFFAGSMSLLPIFADQVLKVGPSGYGWLVAAPALGALLGSFYTAVHPLPDRIGRVLLGSILAYGVMTVVYGLARNFTLMFLALAATGLADLVSTVIRQTVRQVITPDGLRGRMTSVNMIFFIGGPQLGEFEAGVVASLFASQILGVTVSVVSGGLATILVAAIVASVAPVVRNYRDRSHEGRKV